MKFTLFISIPFSLFNIVKKQKSAIWQVLDADLWKLIIFATKINAPKGQQLPAQGNALGVGITRTIEPQHAPKGQQLPAQGNALGKWCVIINALNPEEHTGQREVTGKSIYIMSQSLCKIYLHIVFHTKTTSPSIKEEHLERLHSYVGRLVNNTGCQTMLVGGVSDHVHLVCQLSKNETVAHLLEEVKRNSSRWIKTIDGRYKHFAWQGDYAAFSVSESVLPKTMDYVRNQKAHHTKLSFQEEYLNFLKLYKVEYDERYVFTD